MIREDENRARGMKLLRHLSIPPLPESEEVHPIMGAKGTLGCFLIADVGFFVALTESQ